MKEESTYKKILVKDKLTTCLSGNSRYAKCYGIRHLYRDYLKYIGLLNEHGRILKASVKTNKKYLDYKTFSLIITTCNDLVTQEVSKGDIFKVPSSLGTILVKKPRYTPFMFENTFDRTSILPTMYLKDTSYRLRIYWKKGNPRRDNFYEATLYKFRPCSSFRKKVHLQGNEGKLGTGVFNGVY